MPVIDHAVHPSTQKGADFRYGCWNRPPLKDSYRAPQRRHGSNGFIAIFEFEAIRIPHVLSRECRYDLSETDPCCTDCKHRGSGEAYAAGVQEAGA